MCFGCQRLQIANAKIARAGCKRVVERQSAQCRVAAGTAATNQQSIGINAACRSQIASRCYAIFNVGNAPVTVERLAIAAAVSAASPVVNVDNGKATAGPILNAQIHAQISG